MRSCIRFVLSLLFFLLLGKSTFGYTNEVSLNYQVVAEIPKVRTLKEIDSSIKTLEQEKKNLDFQWSRFRLGDEILSDIVRKDLTIDEKISLENLVAAFIKPLGDTQKTEEDIQKSILLKKQDFYISLVSYIQFDKLPQFKDFVAGDVMNYEKNKILAQEIQIKNIEKQEKIDTYYIQAQENRTTIKNKVSEKVYTQVQEKLDIFIEQDNFKSLGNDVKISIFQKFLDRFSQRIDEMKRIEKPTHVLEDKIYLYENIQEILFGYITLWK